MFKKQSLAVTMKNSQPKFDVLVIGGGPAGISAAARAAESGANVAIVDDNPRLGGQIWRASHTQNSALEKRQQRLSDAATGQARMQAAKVQTFFGMRVFHHPEPG